MPLFKYLHPDRTEVLKNRCIRFSSPCVLNDPFELKPHLAGLATTNYMEDELRRILPKIMEEELAKIPKELRKKIPPKKLLSLLTGQIPKTRMGLQSMATVLLPKLQQTMENKLAELVGILCLSEHPDNLLMWSHYADSHRGYVIAFDERSEFFDRRLNSQDELRHLRRVTYSSKRPSLTLASVDDFSAFMTKGRVWEYEDEWRMIVPLRKR